MKNNTDVTISIVSHKQIQLLEPLLEQLIKIKKSFKKIILTINYPEETLVLRKFSNLPIKIIHNTKIRGFSENHNNAFKFCKTKYFCVLNPDIRINSNIFQKLIMD